MTTNKSDPNALHWYVAYVKSCQERKAAEALGCLGTEYYLPIQKEIHKWSDRNKVVEKIVLPRMIFVRCREHERIPIRTSVFQICGYMSNGGPYNAVVVPDRQLDVFRAMVERSGRAVAIATAAPVAGDKVRVVSGPLAGCECELVSVSGRSCLAVSLGALGTATIELSMDSVEKM